MANSLAQSVPFSGVYTTGGYIQASTSTSATWMNTGYLSSLSSTITFSSVNVKVANLIAGKKLERGWNGRSQPRCSGCARWAKAIDAHTVECSRCLGEMNRW